MPNPTLIFPIAGAFHRPPSVSILKNIALNTPLFCYPDPTNRYDPNAIGIWIDKTSIPFDKIRARPEVLEAMTFNPLSQFHIGFIPAVDAALLKFDRTKTILGIFKINADNKPAILLTGFKV